MERQYKSLALNLQLAQTKYNQLLKYQMDAQLTSQAISSGRSDRIRIVQNPGVPLTPGKPKRTAIAIVGLMLAILLGLTAVVIAEAVDQTVRGSRDIRRVLALSPLGVIPEIQDAATARRERLQVSMLTLCVFVGAAVVLMAARIPLLSRRAARTTEVKATHEPDRGSDAPAGARARGDGRLRGGYGGGTNASASCQDRRVQHGRARARNSGATVSPAAVDPEALERNRVLLRVQDVAVSRAYKILRTRVLHRMADHNWFTLGVTGTGAGEGKTITAINLAAIALAQDPNAWVYLSISTCSGRSSALTSA